MKNHNLTLTFFSFLLAIGGSALTSCNNSDDATENLSKSEILSKYVWNTTMVVDQNNNNLDLATAPAANYVGYAYYKTDGTFRIVDHQDRPRIFGTWKLTDNDTKRSLTVFRTDNTVAFERSVDLLKLTRNEFTYRIAPNAEAPSMFFDVKHAPVNHSEPNTPAETLAEVNWVTTKVFDITNGDTNPIELDVTQAPASNFYGDAYYTNNHGKEYFPKNTDGDYVNGTFIITAAGNKDAVRSRGDWYVSLDGKARTLIARNEDNSVAWRRTVSIFELTPTKFTYDIDNIGGKTLRVEHEPIK